MAVHQHQWVSDDKIIIAYDSRPFALFREALIKDMAIPEGHSCIVGIFQLECPKKSLRAHCADNSKYDRSIKGR